MFDSRKDRGLFKQRTYQERSQWRVNILNFIQTHYGDKEFFIFDPYSEGYSVSNLGRVYSYRKNKFLKPTKNDSGYYLIRLYHPDWIETLPVHRLVTRAFLNDLDYEVNHINADKKDNRLINLELMTRQENIQHARDNNLFVKKKGSDNACFRFTAEIVDDMIAMKQSGKKLEEISKKYSTSISYTSTMIKQRKGGLR